jgi:hypothetical protein
VAGPQGPLPPEQVRAIERYVDEGGDLLLLAGAVILRGRPELAPHGARGADELASGCASASGWCSIRARWPGATPLLAFTLRDGWGDHPAGRAWSGRPASLMQVRELVLEAPATR